MRSLNIMLCFALAISSAACSKKSSTPHDAGPTPTDSPATDAPITPTDSSPGDSQAAGACVAEEAAANAMYGTGDAGMKTIKDLAADCGLQCLQTTGSTSFPASCVTTCLMDPSRVGTAVSAMCLDCFSQTVTCIAASPCALDCAADPNSSACLRCQCGQYDGGVNCIDMYHTCSGIAPTVDCSVMH